MGNDTSSGFSAFWEDKPSLKSLLVFIESFLLSCIKINTANKGDVSCVNSTSEKMPRVHLYQDSNCSNHFKVMSLTYYTQQRPHQRRKLNWKYNDGDSARGEWKSPSTWEARLQRDCQRQRQRSMAESPSAREGTVNAIAAWSCKPHNGLHSSSFSTMCSYM